LHAQIRQAKDALSDAALQIRSVHASLNAADQLIAQIKDNLTNIVKQYPPFSQDSPQRITYLNSITGLRKQLEALTFPPQRETNEIPAQSGQFMEWQNFSPPMPVTPKQGELAIPELAPFASDEEVARAMEQVARAHEQVVQMKQTMWEDVMQFVGSLDSGSAASQAGQVQSFVASAPNQAIAGNTHPIAVDAH
jgi:hypothetical protein